MVDLVLGADRPALAELRARAPPRRARASAPAPARPASPPRRRRGSTGSPPRWSRVSSERQTISGLSSTIGCGGSSLPAQSITNIRLITPSWVAASPIPGASYMVASMSAASARRPSSIASTGLGDPAQPRVGMDQDLSDRHGREICEAPRLDKPRPAPPPMPARNTRGNAMFDFDEVIDRRGTFCSKWDMMQALYGVSPDDGLAMWVADMDFRPPPAVTAALPGRDRPRRPRLLRRRPRLQGGDRRLDARPPRLGGRPRRDRHHPRHRRRLRALPPGLHRARRRGDPVHARSTTPSSGCCAPTAAPSSSRRWSGATTAATPWTSRRSPPR